MGFNCQQSTIYKIEKGLRDVTLGEAAALAAALDLNLDDLTDGQNDSLEPMRRDLNRLASSLAQKTLAVDELALEIVDGQAAFWDLIEQFDELGHYITTDDDAPMTAIQAYGEIANDPLFAFVSSDWRASVAKSGPLRELFSNRPFADLGEHDGSQDENLAKAIHSDEPLGSRLRSTRG